MKKTLAIGGNDVTFECNAVTPVFYKTEFKHDFFADLIIMSKAMNSLDLKEISYEDLEHADFDVLSRLAFACFKTANPKTKNNYMEWLVENPEFSVLEHGQEIAELIISGLQPKKK